MLDTKAFRQKAPHASWCAWCSTESSLDLSEPCAVCQRFGRTYVKPNRRRGPGR